jgi:hypothetical protein
VVFKNLSILSVVSYYRPYKILEARQSPVADMAVLAGIALVGWIAGLIVFIRRDIRTS